MATSFRQAIAFNKKGTIAGVLGLEDMYYLESEKDHVNKRLDRSPQYDGIVLEIDWANQQVKILRHARD